MKARSYSKDRYFQEGVGNIQKLVPEGIEGRVAYKGPLANLVYQLVGGLRSAWAMSARRTSPTLKRETRFVRITAAGSAREPPPRRRSSPRKRRTTGPMRGECSLRSR